MMIHDPINLTPNPLIGLNIDELGPSFPDMSEAYCSELISSAEEVSNSHNITIHKGVYIALTGPTLETPGEYKHIRIIGGDTVGMSTAPEETEAHHMGIKRFARSVITEFGVEGKLKKCTHEEIHEIAENAARNLTLIMKEIIQNIN